MADVLRFNNGPAAGTVGWVGPWPPPDLFVVLVGKTTGQVAHVGDVAGLGTSDVWATVATRHNYQLRAASQLPPMPDDSNVARGAEYDWVQPL